MNFYKLCIWILLLNCKNSWSQQFSENQFAKFTVRDGLSNNYITSVQQDNNGYIWIATDAGLNRFDGNSFTAYHYKNKKVPLLSGKIKKLRYFEGNQLGVINHAGFQVLNTRTYEIADYIIPDSTMFSAYSNIIWDALFINGQTVAIASASGFYIMSKGGNLVFRKDAYTIKDVGIKSIRYARDIFRINEKESLVYLQNNDLGYYNTEQNIFREIKKNDPLWGIFKEPSGKRSGHWISKTQINPTEYLFIQYEDNSIYYYNHQSQKITTSLLPFSTKNEINYETSLVFYNDSTLLVNCGNSGFYVLVLNKKTGSISCNNIKYLPGLKINTIFVDKEKRIWLGTPQGLLMQKLKPDFFTNYSYSATELNDNETGSFHSIYAYKNYLYATRYSGTTGLVVIDKKNMSVTKKLNFYNNRMWNEILSVQMYHDDTVWLGTNAGIIWLDTKTYNYDTIPNLKYRNKDLATPFVLNTKNLQQEGWICYLQSGIIVKYNIKDRSFTYFTPGTSPSLPFTKIKHIVKDADNNIWIAGHSLARLHIQKNLFDTLITAYAGDKKYNNDILLIASDPTGSLWIHNAENGLLQYRTRTHQFISYSREDGLPDINFASMSPVIDSLLWLAGDKSITAFNTITKQVRFYNFPPEITGNKPSGNRIYYDSAAKSFYLLFHNNILTFSNVHKNWQATIPNIHIEEILINNTDLYRNSTDVLHLNHSQKNINIQFSVVDFEENADYKFYYKLKNELPWIQLLNQRNILLTDLPHGSYLLQIKAGKNGYETVKTLEIVIAAPFWKTTWFITLMIIAAGIVIYTVFKKRIRKVRERAELDRKLIETEMKALQSQMNPHFIFNSLNSIKSMILSNNNSDASRYLSKFAHLMRLTLSHSEHAFITLKSTMEYLERYIEMERIRNEDFTYSTFIDDSIDPDKIYVHPMLIQPLIENAIWHGTDKEHNNLHIQIEFKREDDMLVCIVDDNGIGVEKSLLQKDKSPSNHRSLGIKNIKNRIALLNEKYNLESSLTITDKSSYGGAEKGTIVILKLSVNNQLYETHQNHLD